MCVHCSSGELLLPSRQAVSALFETSKADINVTLNNVLQLLILTEDFRENVSFSQSFNLALRQVDLMMSAAVHDHSLDL